jgi:putative transposase
VSFRAFRYRIYPTPEQEQRLRRWEGALRFLWNLALEQWKRGLARTPRIYPSAYGQARELTDLRAEHDWLADLPRRAQASVLEDLEKAWKRCFQKAAGAPRFKRYGCALGVYEAGIVAHPVETGGKTALKFPKLGAVEMVYHRPVAGKVTGATISREVDQWFVSFTCDGPAIAPQETAAHGVVGIDRGVANLFADSEGGMVPRPSWIEEGKQKEDKLRREVDRKAKGSKNQGKARVRVAKCQRKRRRQMEHLLQERASYYANRYAVIVVEDLRIANMTRSARGTVEEPGSNVAQKAGLNRSILSSGWGRFVELLKQKATLTGATVALVPPAYSSQECAECGHIDADNRPRQDTFACLACGHQNHADTNAARVLVKRYLNSRQIDGGEACGGDGVTRPMKQERSAAKRTTAPTKGPHVPKKAA